MEYASVRCVGAYPRITTWINGAKMAEFDGSSCPQPDYHKEALRRKLGRQGPIGLQVHGGTAYGPLAPSAAGGIFASSPLAKMNSACRCGADIERWCQWNSLSIRPRWRRSRRPELGRGGRCHDESDQAGPGGPPLPGSRGRDLSGSGARERRGGEHGSGADDRRGPGWPPCTRTSW